MKLTENMQDTLDMIYSGQTSIKDHHATTLKALAMRRLIILDVDHIRLTDEGVKAVPHRKQINTGSYGIYKVKTV